MGRETPIPAPPRAYASPHLSPDGRQVALDIRDQGNDIWVWDLAGQTLRQLTFDPGDDTWPVWTADGRHIVFASSRAVPGPFNLYRQAVDGTGTVDRLLASITQQFPTAATPDGTLIVGYEVAARAARDLVLFPLGDAARQLRSEPLIQTAFDELGADVSPDGHYTAYQSNESGRSEIEVRPFPQVSKGRWRISNGSGTQPRWSRDGRELFYVDGESMLNAVKIQTTGSTFNAGPPARILDARHKVAPTPKQERVIDPLQPGKLDGTVARCDSPKVIDLPEVVVQVARQVNQKLPRGHWEPEHILGIPCVECARGKRPDHPRDHLAELAEPAQQLAPVRASRRKFQGPIAPIRDLCELPANIIPKIAFEMERQRAGGVGHARRGGPERRRIRKCFDLLRKPGQIAGEECRKFGDQHAKV